MKTERLPSWKAWHERLIQYAGQARKDRPRILFRGHSDVDWRLVPTLDRGRSFENDKARDDLYNGLLLEFRREAFRLIRDPVDLPMGEAFELMARHHGVPSKLLDWSESPYVASFFAFEPAPTKPDTRVAIWGLNLSVLNPIPPEVQIIDNLDLLRLNRRAMQQRGVFTRIGSISRSVEQLLSRALIKVSIPSKERFVALADLDDMSINAATLFADLDGAARTARSRLEFEGRK